jgi:hypothetical protein
MADRPPGDERKKRIETGLDLQVDLIFRSDSSLRGAIVSADVMWVMARNGSKSIAGWSRVGERQRLAAIRELRLSAMAMKYGPYSAISVRIDNGIVLLTLDRPEQLNTFTSAMMNELVGCLITHSPSPRASVTTRHRSPWR